MVVDLFDSTKFFNVFFSLLSCCLFIIFASYTAVVVKMFCGTPPQHHGAVSREKTDQETGNYCIIALVSATFSFFVPF